jgi:hypothetical protein
LSPVLGGEYRLGAADTVEERREADTARAAAAAVVALIVVRVLFCFVLMDKTVGGKVWFRLG